MGLQGGEVVTGSRLSTKRAREMGQGLTHPPLLTGQWLGSTAGGSLGLALPITTASASFREGVLNVGCMELGPRSLNSGSSEPLQGLTPWP